MEKEDIINASIKYMEKKIFVFKYALTKGIIEVDAEIKQGTHEEYTKSKK